MPQLELWIIGLVSSVLYGISIGSFLNVVIYRLPRGQSVSSPTWSYCPSCKHRLGTADLVPLFSFLFLGRKCRYCRSPISWRYFGVEALTGALFLMVFLRFGPTLDVIFDVLFVSLLISIFFIDLEHFIIPDELSALGVGIGIVHNLYGVWTGRSGMWFRLGSVHVPGSVASAVVCALLFHIISLVGLLYYASANKDRSRSVGSMARSFLVGIADDYAYLLLRFLGFGLWLPSAKRFIAVRDAESAESDGAISSETADHEKSREEIAEDLENDEEQTGMGQGDAKLAAMIGANLLLPLSLLSFFIAVLVGTVVGVGVMVARGRGGRTAIPFGPFMTFGALVSMLFGQQLLEWYFKLAFPGS